LMVWTDVASEQEMLDAVGLSGRFPPSTGAADFGITFNNGGPNKMDAYLEHTVTTATRMDDDLGVEVVDVTLELVNTAPATGLPGYVTGNTAGEPEGTVMLYLSVYGTNDVVDAQRDGEPLGVEAPTTVPAAGWAVFVAPTAQRDPARS
jgi:hypothetical protein